jgi:membrane-associated phospholipid phosphatase
MRSRALAFQLAACIALAAAIRWLAFTPGPLARADAGVLALGPLEGSTVPFLIAKALTTPFDPLPYALLLVAVVTAAVLHGRARAGVLAAAVMLGAAATTQVLKHLLAQWRPADGSLPPDAWPSGHTTAAAAFAIALVLVTPPRHRRAVVPAAVLLAVAEGVALVARGDHFPSDVLGGLCVAAAWGALAHALERTGPAVRPPARFRRGAGGRRAPS